MPSTHTQKFDNSACKTDVKINTGLFIDGKWVDPVQEDSIENVLAILTRAYLPNYSTASGRVVTKISVGSSKDVDLAVAAAKRAFKTTWGLHTPGAARGKLLFKLVDLLERDADKFTALDALDAGKIYAKAQSEIATAISIFRYYAGWSDKIQGKTVETNEHKLAYTRHEPYGVTGLIIPWNFPLVNAASKVAPALATGNTVVLKPSEFTPLSALLLADLISEAGFPPGVFNLVNGLGPTVGQAISEHPDIYKISFTGSTLTGRRILKAAAESNLKNVSLELGGKSPTIIFDDADLDQAVKWATHGIFYNMGQVCTAGSRIFVQESVYDKFLEQFTAIAQYLSSKIGDPFASGTEHGPQVSQTQFDRVMSYIEAGKSEGATLHLGGDRHGNEGYFIKPTIFTDCKPDMKIVKEEIFGPVGVVIKFKDEAEVIEHANNTTYGLACHIFSLNINRAIRVTHALEAGNAFVNCANLPDINMPFGGYKQSGIGRELGEAALDEYTQIKAVHINIGVNL